MKNPSVHSKPKRAAATRRRDGGVGRSLTHEGGDRQFALVQAVDGAVGAHHAAHAQAVQHLTRLDQRFARLACCKFAVRLWQQRTNQNKTFSRYLNALLSLKPV